MDRSCEQLFARTDLLKILSAELIAQYDRQQIDFKVANDKNLKYCPGCSEVVARPKCICKNPKDVLCAKCQFRLCILCGNKTHKGLCETLEKQQSKDKEFEFSKFAESKKF
jgi:hypothetical protein